MTAAGPVLALAPFNLYLLALLGAAARGNRRRPPAPRSRGELRFAVVIPAHDEQASIGGTLASLADLDYPRALLETVVIAHNCSDDTAALAARTGATVWEHRGEHGKGAALAWGLARVVAERPEVDAVVVVDADCSVAPNLLSALEARLRAGASAVQAAYEVANPSASTTAALRWASFALINRVRPLGKATLGLSAGLLGTGMAFRRELLAARPWAARSLVEDQEHHLDLVSAGVRVGFAPETWVRSAMPTSLRRSRSQQLRWDAGRVRLLRKSTPGLLAEGVRRRDPVRLHAALEPLVPPQSLLLAANVATAALALRGSRATRWAGVANVTGQTGFVLGGLALARAPLAIWRALALAPALAAWKLVLLSRLVFGGAPSDWVRTARD
jgi:1,2-diacylglycerol 3-beta-glucosyltransferase